LAEQFWQPAPQVARAIRQRQLRQKSALAADIAEIGAARLLADAPALDEDHRAPALAQEEARGRAHDAAADDQHICPLGRAHGAVSTVSTVAIESGFTGAWPRSRPTSASGAPLAAATI